MKEKTVAQAKENPDLLEEQFDDDDQTEESERPPLEIAPKDRKLVTHPYDFIIRSLKDQIEDGTLILADKFQRRRVWEESKASRLVESLLLNVPIPVCYFAELEQGGYSVIDGQQRLTALYRFLINDFPLRGLRVRTELNKKRFNELDISDKRLINSRTIRCIVILKESHPAIRFDVFERLNTSSVKLNAQELRNSVYRGNLNDLIRDLSEHKPFQNVRNVSDIDKRMHDCELVLRFFAFHFRAENYRGSFAPFLDDYLKAGRQFDGKLLDEHKKLFERVIDDVAHVFENQAFRRHTTKGWEKLINRAVYDVVMLSFARLESAQIRAKKGEIVESLQKLCQDAEFNAAITSGTQATRALDLRLAKWRTELTSRGLTVPAIQFGEYK